MPFVDGETLTYEGKVSKNIIRGIAIADLTFTINQPAPDGDYTIKADARSKGTLIKLFRYSFLYQIDSTIGDTEFRANKTVKRDTQKDRVRDSEAVFDYNKEARNLRRNRSEAAHATAAQDRFGDRPRSSRSRLRSLQPAAFAARHRQIVRAGSQRFRPRL